MKLEFLGTAQIEFLKEGKYILENETPQQRYKEIVDRVRDYEKEYKEEGLADRLTEWLDKNYIHLSTPVLSNFGRKTPKGKTPSLPASCNIVTVNNSIDEIWGSDRELANLSKLGAGVGADFTNVVEKGTLLSEGFYSNSKLDYIERFVDTARKVSQGACYSDDTEILTNNGWVLFSQLKGMPNVKVAQVMDDETVEFVHPKAFFEYDVNEELVLFKDSKNIDLLVTKNHSMVYKKEKKSIINGKYFREVRPEFYSKRADECPLHRDVKYLHSAKSKKGEGLSWFERLLIAFQADGSKVKRCKNAIRFRFSKQRKYERLIWILNELGYDYTYSFYEKDKTHNIYINVGESLPKTFDWVTLEGKSQDWCNDFLEEVSLWDSSSYKHGFKYTSTVKINADKIQGICAISGNKSSLKLERNTTGSPKKSDIFVVYVSYGNYFGVEKIEKEFIQYEGKVYCVEVPTNRLVVRRNGRTVVCGNSRRGYCTPFIGLMDNDFDELMKRIDKTNPNANDVLVNNTVGIILPKGFDDLVKTDKEVQRRYLLALSAKKKSGKVYFAHIDNMNQNSSDVYKALGIDIETTNICTEFLQPKFKDMTSVCVLSALNLVHWDIIKNNHTIIRDLFVFLDIVNEEYVRLSENILPLRKAHLAAKNKRDIGAGTLGFHEYLQQKGAAFGDVLSHGLNKQIYSTIRKVAEATTKELAEKLGAAPLAKEANIMKRNCSLIMIAPNKSTSFLANATSLGIEPFISNIYPKKLAKIQYIFKNKNLEKVLDAYNKNDRDTWKSIEENNGSVQHLDFLTDKEKDIFKTFSEISPKDIIDLASERQKYIDMGQSLNLMFRKNYTMKDIYDIHKYAWEKGIKTTYYGYASAHASLEKDGEAWNEGCVSCAD